MEFLIDPTHDPGDLFIIQINAPKSSEFITHLLLFEFQPFENNRRKQPMKSVDIACGGDLPPDVAERLPEIAPFPALVVHGKDDPFMSYAKAREGEQILRDHQFPVDTLYFDGGHDIPPETVAHIFDWILAQPTPNEKENQA